MAWSPPAAPTRARVRWGFGDAVWVAVGGFLAGNIAGAISFGVRHPNAKLDALDDLWGGSAQFAAMVGLAVLLVSVKGRGVRDLGLDGFTWRDLRFVAAGVGVAIALNVSVAPLNTLWTDAGHGKQEIGTQLQKATGPTTALLFLLIVLVAPFTEELLFRGIVLRSALRRMPAVSAVLVAGISFGVFHLIDPDTLPALPALAAFGVVSSIVAVRTGRLAPSIALHVGFNLLGGINLLLTK